MTRTPRIYGSRISRSDVYVVEPEVGVRVADAPSIVTLWTPGRSAYL